MASAHSLALFALFCDLFLGLVVLSNNPKRPTNLGFLILTVVLGAWLTSMDFVFMSRSVGEAVFYIKACSFFGSLVPFSFALLRVTIIFHHETIGTHFWRLRYWLATGVTLAVLTTTSLYLEGAKLPVERPGQTAPGVPVAINGPLAPFCEIYLQLTILAILALLVRDQFGKRISGVHRKELQFVLLGFLTMAATIALSPLIQSLSHNAQLVQFAPLRIVVFVFIIAYGITSRGILQVQAIFRLLLSYVLLAVFAGIVFTGIWMALTWFSGQLGAAAVTWPSVVAATLTALLVNVSSTPMRAVARKILPPSEIDFEKTVSRIGHVVQSVTTLEELLDGFTAALSRAVGTPRMRVFLREPGGGCTHVSGPERTTIAANDPILVRLRGVAADISLESLLRAAPTSERNALLERLETLEADLIVPVRYQGEFSGLLVFQTRPGGRIYGAAGRATLHHIAELLGVAIANSRLYTEARQSQAYNQFLVDHLTCGVIATDTAGTLTVVNPQARHLLLLDESAAAAELELPLEIAGLIPATLDGEFIGRDEEITLSPSSRGEVRLRVSCLPFTSEDGKTLGAVLVLNDFTTLDRLQRQVRQADRLASIGTLASGMAHEIKNPLTTLKTFTQLLPKRFHDAEFRNDFTGLVGGEIVRIERIVNQLLSFARPAPLMIEQVNLHDIIETCIRLVAPHAARQSIQVRKDLRSRHDFVAADKDQLQQVLLNLVLNSIQASENGSWLELSTESVDGDRDEDGEEKSFIRLDVRDNGRGIPAEVLPNIFDPFFTTKSEGTGLGLSVSYNIIAEHKGRLEVRSEVGKGTCFSIYLPVC